MIGCENDIGMVSILTMIIVLIVFIVSMHTNVEIFIPKFSVRDV